MYWWISWWQPTEDSRPLTFPPSGSILGWWCTGYDVDDNASLCAMVKADSEDEAKAAVMADWPEADRWRFCDPRESTAISDRFPLNSWMTERFDAECSRLAARGEKGVQGG